MIRHTLLTMLAIMLALNVFGQEYDQIESEDITQGNTVFRTAGEWASVVIQTKESNKLKFSSNVDTNIPIMNNPAESSISKRTSAVIYSTVKEGGNILYKIRFRTDKKYSNRILSVTSMVYHTIVDIPLTHLEKKREYRYRIFNAVSTEDVTCYREHTIKGDAYFSKCKYAAAREEYKLAGQCNEAKRSEQLQAAQRAEICDSIMHYTEQGNTYAKDKQYEQAFECFDKAYAYNNGDDYLASRYEYCWRKIRNLCAFYLAEAERSFSEKDYETALTLYKEVIDNNCTTAVPVTKRYEDCINLMRKSSNYERYFGLETGGKLWGFTTGSFSSKCGGYFTMRTNGSAFELARKNYHMSKKPTIDISGGVTIPLLPQKLLNKLYPEIFKGAWLNVGIGTMGMAKYNMRKTVLASNEWQDFMGGKDEGICHDDVMSFLDKCHESHDHKGDYKDASDVIKPRYGCLVGGEIGLTVKIWHMALRTTYFLRYPIIDTKKDMGIENKHHFSLGIGWCW